ncbi:hypothetical protein D3C73_736120 [compost metagenome]
MEKTQPFFDPYNFSAMQQVPAMPSMPNVGMQPDMGIDPSMPGAVNPAMYYEQQYMYYKYLTQMLEYKIKLKEFEKMNRETQTTATK